MLKEHGLMAEKSSSETSNTVVAVSGGWDPVHEGHVALLEAAAELGDMLVVGVNDDAWLYNKKGYVFMNADARIKVLESMRCVDAAFAFQSDSEGSAAPFIETVLNKFPNSRVIFANGGDRHYSVTPETSISNKRLEFAWGVGGNDKPNSSSRLIDTPALTYVDRPWGTYQVLSVSNEHKIKTVVVEPGSSTSLQSHQHRSEHFVCVGGIAHIKIGYSTHRLLIGDTLTVKPNDKHQLINYGISPAVLVEVQTGQCYEKDIIRYDSN